MGHEVPVYILLPFGMHLISVDESGAVKVWDTEAERRLCLIILQYLYIYIIACICHMVITRFSVSDVYLDLTFDPKSFKITALLHPSTYLNKIVFASKQGAMQLWNIRTNTLIYTFSGWDEPVTCLEQVFFNLWR